MNPTFIFLTSLVLFGQMFDADSIMTYLARTL